MQTLKGLLQEVAVKLKEVSEVPYLEARMLISKVLGISDVDFILKENMQVCRNYLNEIDSFIKRRLMNEPIAYIIGKKHFMGHEFEVTKNVLIPRNDTEILCQELIDELTKRSGSSRVLELGVGSGAIAVSIALECKDVEIVGVDISDFAIFLSKRNAEKHKVEKNIKIFKKDILNVEFWEKMDGFYDIIYSNPPYIKETEVLELMPDVSMYEPTLALDGGYDGLKYYRFITKNASNLLSKNSVLAFEIGYNQASCVVEMMQKQGYKDLRVIKDFSGMDRVVVGSWRSYD